MGRPGQKVLKDEDGLADRISLGLLARVFPRATVEAVVQAAKAREQRTRMLPSWLVVYYVLALALFMDMGGGRVMRKLAGTLSWAARGVTVVLPSEEALSRARARLRASSEGSTTVTPRAAPDSVPASLRITRPPPMSMNNANAST